MCRPVIHAPDTGPIDGDDVPPRGTGCIVELSARKGRDHSVAGYAGTLDAVFKGEQMALVA